MDRIGKRIGVLKNGTVSKYEHKINDRKGYDQGKIKQLFVGAKVSQYALLPQGQVEAADRVRNMVAQMDLEGFGNCTNTGACEIECPKGISLDNIARMNRELMKASLT